MLYIENNTDCDIDMYRQTVEQAATECLRFEGVGFASETCVTFVGDDEMKRLNSEHRGVDSVTDVLSFPLLDGKEEVARLNKRKGQPEVLLGDIVICLGRALEQADEYGHGILREIGFLTAHGMLHLLGYDHETSEADEKEMFDKQEQILRNISLYVDGE